MNAMSWLRVRPRTLASAAIVAVAAVGITTMAVAYEGNPTTELDLHDGSVWITKADQQFVGHFNAQSQVLDGRLAAPTADYDVLQDGDNVLVHDMGDSTIGPVDTAAVALGDRVQVPAGAVVDYAAHTVAILDVEKGALYVIPLAQVPQFAVGDAKPTIDKLGKNAVVTVGADGTVHAASPEKATLYTIPVTPEGMVDKDRVSEQELEGVDKRSALSITSVADRPVVLDATAGAVILPGQPAVPLPEPEDARLGRDAADGDAVLVATRTELLSIPLDGSEPAATPSGGLAGTPVEPVWLNGCAYGAWMESGRFVRDCVGERNDLDTAIAEYKAEGELRFRVNRDVVMLNNVLTGGAWLASDVLQKVDNWDDLTPPKGDGVENPDPTTVQVPDPSPPDRGEENTPPVATDDLDFGVRPGSSTILPVLDNDSDPDGDVLVVSLPDGPPEGATVQPVNDGSALQITVEEGVTHIPTFRYEVNDGRPGGVDDARVSVSVHGEDQQSPPYLKEDRQIAVPVETGGSITYNVLPDWIDPDGDDIFLESVTPAEGDEAEFTADGRITYRALSGNIGITEANITVSDGRSSMTGVFKLDVRPAAATPPITTADHLVVRAGQQGTVAPLANDLAASSEPLELTQVSEVEGATIVPDFTDDTFTFEAGSVGTYYVDYLVTASGSPPVPGLVRVDVVEPTQVDEPPVAVRDVALLPVGGDALVNVLANDSDPSGGVLVVQSAEVPPDSGLSVSVLGHETLRVTDAGMTGRGGQVTIRYTISNGVAASVEGEVVVMAMPKPSKLYPPSVNDDTAVVRVGDVVTIPVLDNDYHPNDDEFHVDTELVDEPEAGEAFVSEDMLRYRAGDEPGQVQVTYTATDSTGQSDSALVSIQILPEDTENNNAPRPQDVEARALAGTETTIALPLDGIDPDGDSVELIDLASAPKKGTITKTDTASIEYQADPGASGLDTFSYRVRDGYGAVGTATIRVGIAPSAGQNQPPNAVRDSLQMRPGRVVAANVLDNDSDPDGDKVGLASGEGALILGDDPQIEAEVLEDRVLVTAPDTELETTLQYTLEDEKGAQSKGVLQVTVDEDVPLQAPIARDDHVAVRDIDPDELTAEIDLLANDADPDGTAQALVPELDPDDGAQLLEDGVVRVDIQEQRRIIGYTVTDEDSLTARAYLHVPGEEDLRPWLSNPEPAVVKSGERLELALADYVTSARGKDVRITEAEKVSAAHSDGSSLVADEHTLTYRSADRYSGADAITFEVTDGSGPDDPDGRVSTVSIPITVTPPNNEAPRMTGSSVRVGAGDEEPATVDLAGLATDIDQDPLTFSIVEVPQGLHAELNGDTLQVRADPDQKGTVADIRVGVDDGEDNPDQPEPVTAAIEVTVTASTRELPAAADDSFPQWNQGETLTANVLENDFNPFEGEGPLTVVGAELETGAPQDAEVAFDEGSVSVTPADDFHGRLVVRYTVQDQTGDPERTADGRVNVTVQGRPDAPGKPRVVNVQSRQVTLSWTPPADNGATIEGYRVTATKGGEFEQDCAQTTCTLTGLTNNVTYGFTVTARNRVGESDPSPVSQDARPDVRPEMPAAPTVPRFGDSQLTVAWQQPRTEGSPVSGYTLEIQPAMPNGVSQIRVDAPGTKAPTRVIEGLENGQAYRFRVRAHNAAPDPSDWSPWSPTNIPAKPPAAPAAPTAQRQSAIGSTAGGVEVTWGAVEGPAAGGDPVDAYQVQTFRGGSAYGDIHTASGTRYVVTLPADRAEYTFKVRAKNKAGWGAWSAASAPLRQFTSPTAPGTPTLKEGDRQVQASWAPATAKGADASEIRYQYSVNGGGWQDVGGSTSTTIGGLQNGTSYRVAVRAYAVANGATSEPGPSSAQSAAARPYGVPQPPSVSAKQSGAQGLSVTYSWSAPSSSNGRAVDDFRYRIDRGAWKYPSALSGSTSGGPYDYETHHTIEAQVHTAGGWSGTASAGARTADRPQPSASVSNSGQATGYVPGKCSTSNCFYMQLNYDNFPSGNYHVTCFDENSDSRGFSPWDGHLSGAGSQRMDCFYGYSGRQVRLHVEGPGVDFWTPWWTWRQ